jgi:putative membrane protein
MAYDKVNKDDLIIRDYLAAERTHLANERTLLSYLRSALILMVTALSIIKFFETDPAIRMLGFAFFPLAAAVGIFGVYRYIKTRKKLKVFESKGN